MRRVSGARRFLMDLIFFSKRFFLIFSFVFFFFFSKKYFHPFAASFRIVGGKIAKSDEAPYQCAILSEIHYAFCGCAILSSRWIITAAHCVVNLLPNNTEAAHILVGTNDLKSGGQNLSIERIKVHEQYNQPQWANDIAVLKVHQEIEFNARTQPVKLAAKPIPAGTITQLTGWGRLSVS